MTFFNTKLIELTRRDSRYAYEAYEFVFQAQLPNPGARIVTSKGSARVLGQEVLARKLMVEFEDGRRIVINADEILSVIGTKGT